MDHDEIKRQIVTARPDLLFVSFGCPKQEKWIFRNYRTVGAPVMIGAGGTVDFLAGRLKRAPQWMRRTGMESLYRLWQEPRRLWRRYLITNCSFLAKFGVAVLCGQGRGHGGRASESISSRS